MGSCLRCRAKPTRAAAQTAHFETGSLQKGVARACRTGADADIEHMIAGLDPVGMFVASLFLAGLQIGGSAIQRSMGIPLEISTIIQCCITLFVSVKLVFRFVRRKKAPAAPAASPLRVAPPAPRAPAAPPAPEVPPAPAAPPSGLPGLVLV